ncbi:MAG: MBL fold metallo-hydrolase [Bryobacterales bacterium]|nr:MBL fold metallo-hydrolase [Bryobacterales bacterium]
MKITMHRGARQIGGNCVELAVPGARLILDLGLPLDAQLPRSRPDGTWDAAAVKDLMAAGVLPAVDGLYAQGSGDPILALLVSHAYADHYGLASFARPDIPIVAGKYARRLMDLTARIMGAPALGPAGPEVRHEQVLEIGPFRITPYLVDHSAFDAYAFLVESGGRRVLYSGDLRAHGRKESMFEHLVAHGPRGVDALLLEGTTLARDKGEPQPSERDIEIAMIDAMRAATGLVLAWSSGQNIDRLVTIYRAALQSGRKLLIDPYIALVLDSLSEVGSLPKMEWGPVRVLFPKRVSSLMELRGYGDFMKRAGAQGVRWQTVCDRPSEFVAMFRNSMLDDHLRHGTLKGAQMIYSMWSGYLADDRNKRVVEAIDQAGGSLTSLHSVGRASGGSGSVVEALVPRRVVPMHTLVPELYATLGPTISVVDDGAILALEA